MVNDGIRPSIQVRVGNPEEYQFATFIDDRKPQFKIHRHVGLAHSAITNRTRSQNYNLVMTADCGLYRKVEDQWRLVYGFNKGMVLRCLPWQKDPGPPEQRLASDALRSIHISVADLRRRVRHYALDPELTAQIEKECQEFTARIEGLFA